MQAAGKLPINEHQYYHHSDLPALDGCLLMARRKQLGASGHHIPMQTPMSSSNISVQLQQPKIDITLLLQHCKPKTQ